MSLSFYPAARLQDK